MSHSEVTGDDTCRIAQALARNCGYAVFPVRDNKKPATPHGYKDSASDADAVARLWRRHSGPLIGVATGGMSGIDLLDLDIKHPPAIAWWQVNEHRIPATRTYRSRGGGLHLNFQHAAGVANTASKICEGVDTRGDGGYLVYWFAAGFDCLDHTAPAPWPAWLLAALHAPKQPPIRTPTSTRWANAPRAIDGILRTVARATEGERNPTLYWASCRLGERIQVGQIGTAEAEHLLLDAARHAGLSDTEALATIRSGLRRVAA